MVDMWNITEGKIVRQFKREERGYTTGTFVGRHAEYVAIGDESTTSF
jgi:hypothetical protein